MGQIFPLSIHLYHNLIVSTIVFIHIHVFFFLYFLGFQKDSCDAALKLGARHRLSMTRYQWLVSKRIHIKGKCILYRKKQNS